MDEVTGTSAEALTARLLDSPESVRFETKRVSGKMVGEPRGVVLLPQRANGAGRHQTRERFIRDTCRPKEAEQPASNGFSWPRAERQQILPTVRNRCFAAGGAQNPNGS